MTSFIPTIGTRLTFSQRDIIDPSETGINNIPDGPTVYIISQLEGKDLCNMAQVSRRFNTLTEQHRELYYSSENFDTLMGKGTINIIGVRWLIRHHPERRCSSRVLNWASLYGHIKVVALLLAANKPCTTWALDSASRYGYIKIVRLLLAAGSPYSDCTEDALDWASANGHTEIVRLLLAANKPCTEYALNRASINGHTEIIILLLEENSPKDYTKWALDWFREISYRDC